MPSLVGSEMCIRDRAGPAASPVDARHHQPEHRRQPRKRTRYGEPGWWHSRFRPGAAPSPSVGHHPGSALRRKTAGVPAGAPAQGSATVRGLSLIHISEPTRLGMISYAVFCLKKKKNRLLYTSPSCLFKLKYVLFTIYNVCDILIL